MKGLVTRLKKFIKINAAPICLAAYPIIYLFSENYDRMSWVEVPLPLVIAVILALLFSKLLTLFTNNGERAAIIASIWVIFFFSFRLIIQGFLKSGLVDYRSTAVGLTQWGVSSLLIFFSLWCCYTSKKIDWLYSFLRIGSFALLVLGIGSIGFKAVNSNENIVAVGPEISPGLGSARTKPDIYYILLDGFGRFDVLRAMYGVDSTDFNESLKSLGFYVAENSRTNYIQTLLSLSSTLNMDYLDTVVSAVPKKSKDRSALRELVRNSKVMKFLKSSGYTTYSFSSGYSGTDLINTDHRIAVSWVPSEFHNLILKLSPLPNIFRQFGIFQWQYSAHRRRLNFIFDELPRLGRKVSPKFVFAHIMAPHPPFVFDSKGRDVWRKKSFAFDDGSHFKGTKREYIADYGGQVTHLMDRIVDTVAKIAKRDPFAIIILQGDHGPGVELNWKEMNKTNLWERTSILNAYRMGAAWPSEAGLRSDITPVNSFRLVLNELFQLGLPELPDRTFYSPWNHPYDFTEVDKDIRPQLSSDCRSYLSGRVGQATSDCE